MGRQEGPPAWGGAGRRTMPPTGPPHGLSPGEGPCRPPFLGPLHPLTCEMVRDSCVCVGGRHCMPPRDKAGQGTRGSLAACCCRAGGSVHTGLQHEGRGVDSVKGCFPAGAQGTCRAGGHRPAGVRLQGGHLLVVAVLPPPSRSGPARTPSPCVCREPRPPVPRKAPTPGNGAEAEPLVRSAWCTGGGGEFPGPHSGPIR